MNELGFDERHKALREPPRDDEMDWFMLSIGAAVGFVAGLIVAALIYWLA